MVILTFFLLLEHRMIFITDFIRATKQKEKKSSVETPNVNIKNICKNNKDTKLRCIFPSTRTFLIPFTRTFSNLVTTVHTHVYLTVYPYAYHTVYQ